MVALLRAQKRDADDAGVYRHLGFARKGVEGAVLGEGGDWWASVLGMFLHFYIFF